MSMPGFQAQQAAQQAQQAQQAAFRANQQAAADARWGAQASSAANRAAQDAAARFARFNSGRRPVRGGAGVVGRFFGAVAALVVIAFAIGVFVLIADRVDPHWFHDVTTFIQNLF
jgi:hypothetical protein